ncbi:MAG: hypothetical protein ABSC06_31250 [Rhodopila sp.]|jgi:hypothetical protein
MSGAESLRHRYGAPPVRPAPYLFLRDREAERREGLLVAGRLLCPWPQPLTDQRRDELARIEARLAKERERGLLGPLGSWVTEDRIVPFTVQSIEWLKRMAADGLRIPIRIVSPVG